MQNVERNKTISFLSYKFLMGYVDILDMEKVIRFEVILDTEHLHAFLCSFITVNIEYLGLQYYDILGRTQDDLIVN